MFSFKSSSEYAITKRCVVENDIGNLLGILFGDNVKGRQDARQRLAEIGRSVILFLAGL